MNKLTTKQQRFVDFYDGNATEAARLAGYRGNNVTLRSVGKENLLKPHIKKAIQERETKRKASTIATREDRQNFWTEVMNDIDNHLKDRLRASELLGKSEGDFLERRDVSNSDGTMQTITKIEFVAPTFDKDDD